MGLERPGDGFFAADNHPVPVGRAVLCAPPL